MPYEAFSSINITVMLFVLNTGRSHCVSQDTVHVRSKIKWTDPVKPKKYYTGSRTKKYRRNWGADKSLARPGRKQATATEDFEFHVSYL